MSSDWRNIRVEEIALDSPNAMSTGPFGSAISSKFFKADGVPVIRGGNLSTDISSRMSDEKLVFVSKDKAAEFKRSLVRSGDLIFTCWGTINQVGLINDELGYPEYVVSNKQMKLTPDPKKANSLFLYYLFSSPMKQAEIVSNGIGAAVPGFNLGQLKNHVINLPSIAKQKRIANILDLFDRKIRHNNQINQTLESMAQTIFRSWFVDFDPVKAKIAALKSGEDAEGVTRAAMRAISGKTDDELNQMQSGQPEEYAQLKTTAELFPATMQDSELGEVPEGWNWKRADETCDISIGKTPPRKEPQWFSSFPDGLKWVSIRDMGKSGVFALDTSETLTNDAVKKFNVKKVPDNTLILSFKLTVGRVAITSGEMLTNEAIAHFIQKPEINISTSFYYLYLKQFDYNSLGSTSSIATAVNSKTIKVLPIINPLENMVVRFDAIVEPLFSQIKLMEEENIEISLLRDTLLPKLLSGELSVDGIEMTKEK